MTAGQVRLKDYVKIIRSNRNFRLLWLAQIISEMGDWFYSAALLTLLLELTGKAQAVGLVLVFQVLPQVLAAPLAGLLNDRLSRRRVMLYTDWARCVVVAGMLFVVSPATVWLAFALQVIETVLWAHFEPARNSAIPNITVGDELHVANTLSAATWSFNFTMGFALGGITAAFLGRPAVFLINSLSFAGSALLIRRMRFDEPHLRNALPFHARDIADFSSLIDGFCYLRANLRLAATIAVKGGIGLIGANWVFLTIMGERLFPLQLAGLDRQGAGLLGMSLLMGSRGLGSLLGPLIGNRLAGTERGRMRAGITVGFLMAASGYMLLGSAASLPVACAWVALSHAGSSIAWVFSTTLVQAQTEDRFRGRVSSAEFALMTASLSLTSYLAGVLVDAGVPVHALAFLTGVLMLLPAAAWALAQGLWSGETEVPRGSRKSGPGV